jgi:hypothetical protein
LVLEAHASPYPGRGESLLRTSLEDDDVDARQCELARQHEPRRTAPGDHHRMLGHGDSSFISYLPFDAFHTSIG